MHIVIKGEQYVSIADCNLPLADVDIHTDLPVIIKDSAFRSLKVNGKYIGRPSDQAEGVHLRINELEFTPSLWLSDNKES